MFWFYYENIEKKISNICIKALLLKNNQLKNETGTRKEVRWLLLFFQIF